MKARLLAIGVPAFLVAAIFGGAAGASRFGWITPQTWDYLWPFLVAFALLAFAVGLLFLKLRWWVLPLVAGFLVQTVCSLMWVFDPKKSFNHPSETLLPTAVAIGAVLIVLFTVWLVAFLRARSLERRMLEGVGTEGADAQKLEQIRKDMLGALALLKKAGAGRNAIYDLPWCLVIGRPQVGKTVAIKNSGLSLPVRKDWVKGVGGTFTCDWFFTNDLIFLDTPGAWVNDGVSEEAQGYWTTLLKLLRKYRGRRPLDGLLVTVSADDLIGKPPEELQRQAGNIREVIDLLHDELRFRFPVYILVSKCDLVEGFVEFFRGVPPQRWHEILGWSNPDPNAADVPQMVGKGFAKVLRRLRAYRLELLARTGRVSRARKIFFFPEELRRIGEPLAAFADVLFYEDPSHETPVFRGFYFTSGTQGEGFPIGNALAELARRVGIRPSAGAAEEKEKEEPKRSYFLLELFRHLVVGDEGLISRTAGHWWRRRRDTMTAAFLPATAACTVLLLSLLSFTLNRCSYRYVETEVPQLVAEIKKLDDPSQGKDLLKTLDYLEGIQKAHHSLVDFNVARRFWMRQSGPLADSTLRVLREQFETNVLGPTLERASAAMDDPKTSCFDLADTLYAVLWMRAGNLKDDQKDNLRSLDASWDLVKPDDIETARERFLDLFAYVNRNRNDDITLLPGFDLRKSAERVAKTCGGGAGSSLEGYLDFQRDCLNAVAPDQVRACYTRLDRAVQFDGEGFQRLQEQLSSFDGMLSDLHQSGRHGEEGAAEAKEALSKIGKVSSRTTPCSRAFQERVTPKLKEILTAQEGLIRTCADEIRRSPNPVQAAIEKSGAPEKDDAEKLKAAMGGVVSPCTGKVDAVALDGVALARFLTTYRRVQCTGETAPAPRPAAPRVAPAGGGGGPARPKPAPLAGSFSRLAVPVRPSEQYTKVGWNAWKVQQEQKLANAATAPNVDPAQREQWRAEVRGQVEDYARRYVEQWQRYLSGLDVRPDTGSVPSWIRALADSPEYALALQPAADALGVEGLPQDNELALFRQTLLPLSSLSGFVSGRLPDYRGKLRRLADDLDACDKDPARRRAYLNALDRPDNSLRDAQAWVDQYATDVAGGALKRLLTAPLDRAKAWVSQGDWESSHWEDVRKAYRQLAETYPFSTTAGDLPEVAALTALLGGKTGIARALYGPGGAGLADTQKAWLKTAVDYSEAFFKPDSDEPKELTLTLALQAIDYDPPDLKDDLRLEKLVFSAAPSVSYTWSQAVQTAQGKVPVTLFGPDASGQAYVDMTVADAKRGNKWIERPTVRVKSANGAWAPIKVLVQGLESPEARGNNLTLKYALALEAKHGKPRTVTVTLSVAGSNLAQVLRIAQKGLEAPPTGAGPGAGGNP